MSHSTKITIIADEICEKEIDDEVFFIYLKDYLKKHSLLNEGEYFTFSIDLFRKGDTFNFFNNRIFNKGSSLSV